MALLFQIIIGLVILMLLVVAHELGHAIVARRNGVNLEEFGIGMPPRAWKMKLKSGLLFTINWLPLGGFVKMQGEYDAANKKGDYGAAKFWQKTKILFAGVTANWAIAIILLTILAFTGMPKVIENQFSIPSDTVVVSQPVEIVNLIKDHAAEKAGLKNGDIIVVFDGKKIKNGQELINIAKTKKGQVVKVNYQRKGIKKTIDVKLGTNAKTGIFGADLGQRQLTKSTWSAPIVGVATTAQFTWATFSGLGDMIVNLTKPNGLKNVGDSVTGPIGILGTIFPQAEKAGLTQLVLLTAIISLSLAVTNILPIPALDGGRWYILAIFRLTKKKLTEKHEEKIQMIGSLILITLIILITINDVTKLF